MNWDDVPFDIPNDLQDYYCDNDYSPEDVYPSLRDKNEPTVDEIIESAVNHVDNTIQSLETLDIGDDSHIEYWSDEELIENGNIAVPNSMDTEQIKEQVLSFAHSDPDNVQDKIGNPGTKIFSGLDQTETSSRARPHIARGFGIQGKYSKYYRTEPLLHKTINEYTHCIKNATYTLNVPEGYDDNLNDLAEDIDKHIKNIKSGFRHFLDEASRLMIFGFMPFEIQWATTNDFTYPYDLLAREPQTVERWIFDDELRLKGSIHMPMGDPAGRNRFTIPYSNQSVQDDRLLVCNVNDHGAAVEGISPIRPLMHFIEAKQLLLQLIPISFQKYGVPIALVSQVAEEIESLNSNPTKDDIRQLISDLRKLRAKVPAVVKRPAGVDVSYRTPGNSMPDFLSQLEYLDEMILKTFSNESTMIGTSQHGSFALIEGTEDRKKASALYFGENIVEELNRLMRNGIKYNAGKQESYPTYEMSVELGFDVQAWLKEVRELMPQREVLDYPPTLKRRVEEELGIEDGTFDEEVPPLLDPIDPNQRGGPPSGAAETEPDGDNDNGDDSGNSPTPEANTVSGEEQNALNTEVNERLLDRYETRLRTSVSDIHSRHRREFQRRFRQNPENLDRILDSLASQYERLYEITAMDVMTELKQKAAQQVTRELDVDVDVDTGPTPRMESRAAQFADDVVYEAHRKWRAQVESELETEDDDHRRITLLADSTFERFARFATSTALNDGRTEAAEEIEQNDSVPGLVARRTAVMDSNTCESCARWDGEVVAINTDRYNELKPPSKCDGYQRCRCSYSYDLQD